MTDTAVVFNPFEPGFFDDPYVQYSAMRASEPVHQSLLGPWVLTAYDDVVRVLRDPSLSAEDRNMAPGPLSDARRDAFGERSGGSRAMLNLDPPDHDRLRRLVQKAFTPKMVESLRPTVEHWVDVSLDAIAGNEHADLIADLAFPLPFTVISEMLGMPDGNRDELRAWSHAVVKTLDPVITDVEIAEAVVASDAMTAYLLEVIAAKRKHLTDDLLSGLIAAEEGGDVLDEQELIDQVLLLYVAGHETTVNLIGNGSRALLTHPDQAERLRNDPALDANAVEELLRWDSPVQFSRRIAMSAFLVGDVRGRAGRRAAHVPRRGEPRPGPLGPERRRARSRSRGCGPARVVRQRRPSLPRRVARSRRGARRDRQAVPSVPGSSSSSTSGRRGTGGSSCAASTLCPSRSARSAGDQPDRTPDTNQHEQGDTNVSSPDVIAQLSEAPLFARCSRKELAAVVSTVELREAPEGEVLVRQGDSGDAFYVIIDGTAVVRRDGRDIAELRAGDFFGELALLDPAPRNADVVAAGPVRVAAFDEDAFEGLLRELPSINRKLMAAMSKRLRAADMESVSS